MQYVRKQEKIDAIQLGGKTTIEVDEGELVEGNAGDWMIRTDTGEVFILDDDEFKSKYEPLKPRTPSKPAMKPDEVFDLYDERRGGATQQFNRGYHADHTVLDPRMQAQPPQRDFNDLPPMIPVGQQQSQQPTTPQQHARQPEPQQQQQAPRKKKSSAIGGLFGGKKKPRRPPEESQDFMSDNIQTV